MKYITNLLAAIVGADRSIEQKLDLLLKGQKMADQNEQLILDALTTLETEVANDFVAVGADLTALANANPSGISPADATAIAQRITKLTEGMKAQTAAAKAALLPPPPPVTTGGPSTGGSGPASA